MLCIFTFFYKAVLLNLFIFNSTILLLIYLTRMLHRFMVVQLSRKTHFTLIYLLALKNKSIIAYSFPTVIVSVAILVLAFLVLYLVIRC